MKTILPSSEPPVNGYARLLRELHRLIAEGKGDDEEADAIREEMDAPWYSTNAQEHDRVGGLSEDLYAIAEGGVKAVDLSPAERACWQEELARAFQMSDWDRALGLLRKPPREVPPEQVASMQAACWEQLGDAETARVFQREAERLHRVPVTSGVPSPSRGSAVDATT